MAQAVAHDPHTVFCVEPLSSVQDENGNRLARLLARVVANPHRSLLVVTENEFVFGFIEPNVVLLEDGRSITLQGQFGDQPEETDLN